MDGERVIKSLKSLLLSRKHGMFIQDLVNEYRQTEDTEIPFQELGYDSFLDLLRASGSFNVNEIGKKGFFVTAKPSKNSKHIIDLVKRQHSNKNLKHRSHSMPLKLIDENQAMKKPQTNGSPDNQNKTFNGHSVAVCDDNNNNNNDQNGRASSTSAVYHDENKINISNRLKQNRHDVIKRFKQDVLGQRDDSTNQTFNDMLNGPFNPQCRLANRTFNTMNGVLPKMTVQIRLEIPKFIEIDESSECDEVMADTVSQIDGCVRFEIDHSHISHSAMQQSYNNRMAIMDNGPHHNDLNLERIPFEYDQLKETEAMTEIPLLELPWYDDEWPITVTTVASTDDVWGYLRGHDYFPKLESTLKRHEKAIRLGKKVLSLAKNIKPGGYYYTMIPECYRVRVLDNNENDRMALCLLIDYAEDEWFNWDQIYEMDHELANIPCQAVRFSLIDLEEYASHKAFTNKAITCLIGTELVAKVKTTKKDFAMQKLINRMDPKVKILAFNQLTGQNVNEAILAKDDVADAPMNQIKCGPLANQFIPNGQSNAVNVSIPMETESIVKQMEIPIRNLPAKKQIIVIITSATSPSDFHFRLLSDDGIMSSLMKSFSAASFTHRPDSDEIKAGNYYAAKFSDARWYRCQVKNRIGNMVDTYRCDVGDSQTLQTVQLCTLTAEFIQWPQLAIPAKLNGIIPVDGIWTDEANAYFRKLTLNTRLQAQFAKSQSSHQNGISYPIEVTLIESQLRTRIGDLMIEQCFAQKTA